MSHPQLSRRAHRDNLCVVSPRGRICVALGGALWTMGVALSSWPTSARAADPTHAPVTHARRGGFTLGIALGPSVGAASGYPNDVRKIDRPDFFTRTGVSGGGAGTAWLGVTFTDWLSFALAGYGGMVIGAQERTRHGALAFRVEAFPAYLLGGAWRDVGASLEAGVGVSESAPKGGGDHVIDSGGASRFAFGLFYEGIRAWKLSLGPFAAVDVMWSSSALRTLGWIGWRTTLYARP